MGAIERFLHEHFASIDDDNSQPPDTLPDAQLSPSDEAFAKVNTVAPNSPAEHSGLKAGDEIRSFGYVNMSNHDNLRRVAECVQGNEGVNRAAAARLRTIADMA